MHTGSCQCGEVRYQSLSAPLALYICHCLECQKQSASAFGISLDVPSAGFSLMQGTPHFWSRLTASGNTLRCAFCPTCGTRLWHETDTAILSIKAGTLDQTLDVSTAIHVWVTRKLPGIVIPPEAQQFPFD